MFFFLLKFVSLGDPFTCTPTPCHHPTLCPTTAFVEDTTVRWDIHRGRQKKRKENTRRRLTFGRTACGGWNGYPRSDWTATWRDEGFSFFFFFLLATKKTKKIKRWHDVTAAVRGCISLLDPCQVPLKCLLPSAPPSFSPIKKENVSGVRGRVWEVPLVALDTEYCLQSRDGLPSTVSKRSRPPSALGPSPRADAPPSTNTLTGLSQKNTKYKDILNIITHCDKQWH